ncbi:MAG: glycosyltransferase [Bacteroidales bacterium]|nr:glycosyltransferase [Bacteroidales bacterium]
MPTLLHYIPSIDETSGGVGAYMQLLTRDLGKLCDLHVLTHQSPNERQLQGCTLHYIDNKFLPWDNCKKDFLRILDQVKPDIVHVNCCWMPLCSMVAQWAKDQGLKVVYTPHGMLEPWILSRHYWTRKLPAIILYQRRAIRLADAIHATADSERQNLLALGWNKNIHVIGNCINVDDIVMKSSWQRRKSILFLSRVHVKKGINFLIEAVAKLKDQMDGYVVKIAGPGDETYLNELKSLAQKLGVADQVQFIGSVFGKEKFDLYREADLFVLPTHSENFGIVVTEALACGTPVVTTKGAPWAELESHHCGWWTEIGADPTAEALKSFLSLSESDLELMGRNGRALVEERYSCQKIAQEFMALYSSLSFSHTPANNHE